VCTPTVMATCRQMRGGVRTNKRIILLIAIIAGIALLSLVPRGLLADASVVRVLSTFSSTVCMCTFEEARGVECDEYCARAQLYNTGWEFYEESQRLRRHPRYYPAHASICERGDCATLRTTQSDLVRETAVALWFKTGCTAFPTWYAASSSKFPRVRAAVNLLRSGNFEAFQAGLQGSKTRGYAEIVPGALDTYTFKTEAEYYDAYASSWYAHTWAKAGYDAMRHIEIIGNGAIPVFRASDDIPVGHMVGCEAPMYWEFYSIQ
jgi:hypothetical protein